MAEEKHKYVTGFCASGLHEGMRVPGPSGKLNKTCSFIEVCKCEHPQCHSFYDRMFENSGMERAVVDNSGYVSEKVDWWMPKPIVVEAPPILSNSGDPIPDGALESVAPGVVPPTKRPSYTETPTGRAARGQLEDQVNRVCITWAVDQPPVGCTPSYISTEIGKTEGIKNPSVGAIDSVFKRWEQIGYAVIAKHPTRFINFSDDGIEFGLDYLKERARHAR